MAERALLRVAPSQTIATLWIAELRDAGFPVETVQESYAFPNANAPVEIWILDKSLLDLPGVATRIDRLLEEPEPEELPEEFREETSAEKASRIRWWHVPSATFFVFVLWVVGCGRTTEPKFDFMKNAARFQTEDKALSEWLGTMGMHGTDYRLDVPFEQAVQLASDELTKSGYYEHNFGEEVQFDRTELTERIRSGANFRTTRFPKWEVTDLIYLRPQMRFDENGKVVVDRNSTIVVWAYRPSNAQRIGRSLSL